MKEYSSLSNVIDRGGGCRSEEKGWKPVKDTGGEEAKKPFVEEVKKQLRA